MTEMTIEPRAAARPAISYGQYIRANLRQYAMLLALAGIMVFFGFATDGILFSPQNLTNLVSQNSYIVIMALGMLLIIVAGHIDLSVGFLAGFIGAIAGTMMVPWAVHPAIAFLACLVIGGLFGAIQGYFVAYQKIPSFIVTLAGMLVFRGLMIWLLQGRPSAFRRISS